MCQCKRRHCSECGPSYDFMPDQLSEADQLAFPDRDEELKYRQALKKRQGIPEQMPMVIRCPKCCDFKLSEEELKTIKPGDATTCPALGCGKKILIQNC